MKDVRSMIQKVITLFQFSSFLRSSYVVPIVVAAAYVVTAKVSLLIRIPPGDIAPIYPAAGIALAAALLYGRRALIGIFLGGFVASMIAHFPNSTTLGEAVTAIWPFALVNGIGAMLGAGAGLFLIRRICKDDYLQLYGRNMVILVLIGALGCCMLNPTIGVFSLSVGGIIPWSRFGFSWLTWWMADAVGVIVAAPLILAWFEPHQFTMRLWRIAEGVALSCITVLLSYLVFFRNIPLEYGLLPLMLWAAYSFGMRGATTSAAVIAILASVGTSLGSNRFVSRTVDESLLYLYSFLGVAIVYVLYLAGILAERKLAEKNLRQLSQAVEQSPVSIVITDTRGSIEYVNSKFCALTGYTFEEAIGKNPRILKSGFTRAEEYTELWKTLTAGNEWCGEFHNRKKSGDLYWESAQISPIKNENGDTTHYVAVKEDITERKQAEVNICRMEERLRQSEKMEAVGQLAGGIAHDFNNVLGGIIGFTDISLNYVEKDSMLEKNLLRVLKAADRAKHLVRQILAFSRQGNPQKTITSICPIIQEVLDLLTSSIPSSVIIHADLEQTTKPVAADSTQIHQALLNLATNAVHAMKRKGTLTVRLHGTILDSTEYGQGGEILPGAYTVVEVADTGCGMDPVTLSKAFEPFFTTKPVGEGTGMGLSVVLGIVQSHGGELQVETEVGKGTTIRIFLPAINELTLETRIADKRTIITGAERILFVDDEPTLVDMAKSFLPTLGYSVVSFTNSLAALKFIEERSDEIDLLVTDQTMPGVTGIELVQKALEIRPDLSVILCTGFSEDVNSEITTAMGINRLVMKPYGIREIIKSIRDVLDSKNRAID